MYPLLSLNSGFRMRCTICITLFWCCCNCFFFYYSYGIIWVPSDYYGAAPPLKGWAGY